VAHNTGLTVAEITDLRRRVREVGGSVKVAKNRLARLALKDTPPEGISDLFKGPTIIAYADDPVSVPKVTVNFAKDNDKLVVLGGSMGDVTLDVDGVKSLASLPSLDELRGKLVGLLQAPAGKVVRVLAAPPGQLARVISAHAEKGEAA
jgi:large subunit ribosomal protein L10